MKRRALLLSATGLLAHPALIRSAAAQSGRVLKFVPHADLAALDPIITPAFVTRNAGMLVFDTLYGVDENFVVQPQMVAGHTVENDGLVWRLTLRDGLRFHDHTPVLARDVVASLKRWAVRDNYGVTVFPLVDELSALSDKIVQFRLKRPFHLLADMLGKPMPQLPVIMPERLAQTAPTAAVPEMIGSGPYRVVPGERVAGSRNVFERFADYIPRPDGTPSFMAGPKMAHLDRIEWHTIPDPATAAAALQNGEIDWWEAPTPDLLPVLRKNPNITVGSIDLAGVPCVLRFNHLQPPFDDPAMRRALLGAVNQTEIMQAVAGEDRTLWRDGVGFFLPGTPMASDAGMAALTGKREPDRVRADLQAAGYRGERIAFPVPTDIPAINAMSEVIGDALRKAGVNLDYQTKDWATVAQQIGNKGPIDKGGWNLTCNIATGFAIVNPAAHAYLRGTGANALFGWPTAPKLESLRAAWMDATDPAEQARLGRDIQLQAFEDVPYIPLGLYYQATAYRKGLSGLLKGGVPLFYNLDRS